MQAITNQPTDRSNDGFTCSIKYFQEKKNKHEILCDKFYESEQQGKYSAITGVIIR
jgi:hypothetical protein